VGNWTKENIDKLDRVHVEDAKFKSALSECNKVIYCTGLKRNALLELVIDGKKVDLNDLGYDQSSGRINEKLYGFGIAFPKLVTDKMGNKENSVGVWDFMWHSNEVISELASQENRKLVKVKDFLTEEEKEQSLH